MKKKRIQAALLVLFVTGVAYASAFGPAPGYSGAPGDIGNCVVCHDTFNEANVGPGNVQIANLPAMYEPNQQYTLAITVQQAGRQRFGFQLTAIDKNGARAGTFAPLDGSTQLNALTGPGERQYIQHTHSGSFSPTAGTRTFQVRWTAPAEDIGPVRFYFAGNAANNDGTNQNDHIYTNTALLESPTTLVTVQLAAAPAGQVLKPGDKVMLAWNVTNPSNVEGYDVRYSTDDGATFPITNQIFSTTNAAATAIEWTVPDRSTTAARIRVQALTKSGSAIEAVTEAFTIDGTGSAAGLPFIESVELEGKKLFVNGGHFQKGAKIEINGVPRKTKIKGGGDHRLLAKKGGKKIAPGSTVMLTVLNPDGNRSAPFIYTRPPN